MVQEMELCTPRSGRVSFTICAKENEEENKIYRVFDMGRWKEAKICIVCKRQFTWRKKWERCWESIQTCSEKCKADRKSQKGFVCPKTEAMQ